MHGIPEQKGGGRRMVEGPEWALRIPDDRMTSFF